MTGMLKLVERDLTLLLNVALMSNSLKTKYES